jgi:hypothetical protein
MRGQGRALRSGDEVFFGAARRNDAPSTAATERRGMAADSGVA